MYGPKKRPPQQEQEGSTDGQRWQSDIEDLYTDDSDDEGGGEDSESEEE